MAIQNEPDWVSLASLAVSFCAAFFSWAASRKANDLSKENTSIQNGIIELEIRQAIENASAKINDIAMIMAPLTAKNTRGTLSDEEKETLQIYNKSLDAATQSFLNTYDGACSKYLDGKIDKLRFKKDYHVEIRNLLENQDLKPYFDSITSKYKPILLVYNEWENHEHS